MFPDAYIFRADDASHRVYSTKSIWLSYHSSRSHLVHSILGRSRNDGVSDCGFSEERKAAAHSSVCLCWR